jgi:DNA-binding transcriptional regulator YdaS (Cro superfamily)
MSNAKHVKALKRAIDAAGGPTALARRLRRTQAMVSKWIEREQVPAEWVLTVEAISGVPCYELRPDLYRKPEVVA